MTTYALGIQERIDNLRGAIARIEALRDRCRKLEASGADPGEIERARALWKAHEREFGSTQWATVKTVIEHYTTVAAAPTPAPAPEQPPAAPARKGVARALTATPTPEVRRARYLAGKNQS